MIKCNVTVCGTISRAAAVRTNNEGKPFTAFGVKCMIPAKNGAGKAVDISVALNGKPDDIVDYATGNRIEVTGVLTFKKRGDNVFFNLSASSADLYTESEKDSIAGEMQFRGKTGKNIDEKTLRDGKKLLVFSAFSSEKVNDTFEFLWVRFLANDREREEWLQPKTHIEAKGDLELSVYNGRLDIGCRVSEMSEYVGTVFNSKG